MGLVVTLALIVTDVPIHPLSPKYSGPVGFIYAPARDAHDDNRFQGDIIVRRSACSSDNHSPVSRSSILTSKHPSHASTGFQQTEHLRASTLCLFSLSPNPPSVPMVPSISDVPSIPCCRRHVHCVTSIAQAPDMSSHDEPPISALPSTPMVTIPPPAAVTPSQSLQVHFNPNWYKAWHNWAFVC